MAPDPPLFSVGERYSSDEIQASLHVGNAGGLRVCLDDEASVRRMVVLTSVPGARQATENPYHDRMEGDVLVYTGAGREGDQSLAGINRRIPQQIQTKFPIYGFQLIGSRRDRTIGPRRWQFMGLLEYLRHYPEFQLDTRRQMRQAWLFEFFVHTDPTKILVTDDQMASRQLLAASNTIAQNAVDDRQVISLFQEAEIDKNRDDAVEIESQRIRLLGMLPEEFEHVVRDALVGTGFERVDVTRYSQDGGIDVNAYAGAQMWPIRELLIQVQAKRWLHTVGRKDVAELRGSLRPFARGALVTTSHFSRAAVAEAQETGKNPIVLVDGYTFAATVRSLGSVGD